MPGRKKSAIRYEDTCARSKIIYKTYNHIILKKSYIYIFYLFYIFPLKPNLNRDFRFVHIPPDLSLIQSNLYGRQLCYLIYFECVLMNNISRILIFEIIRPSLLHTRRAVFAGSIGDDPRSRGSSYENPCASHIERQ